MILGVDIGGTTAKLALVTRDGQITARSEISTCIDQYRVPVIDCVIHGIDGFLKAANVSVEGIGVSATGQIDDREGIVIGTNGKIPGYEGTEIRKVLEARFDVPVTVLNDANAAALGECFAGKGRGRRHVLMVTLGTGVGGGIVTDGRVFSGTRGIAGEIGHFTLYQDGEPCPCGKHGCFESYASTSALVSKARETYGDPEMNGRLLFEKAAAGDPAAIQLIDRWTDDIAAGLSSLIHIFNPETVLIGGGVSKQEKLLMQPLRKKTLAQIMPRFREELTIEAAGLGNDAGVIGAAAFWMDRVKH